MESLDTAFFALSDPTRRAILARLAGGEVSVMELAEPFAMSQPAVSRHLKVLEGAGLIARRVDGTRRPCRLEDGRHRGNGAMARPLHAALARNYDRLDRVLAAVRPSAKRTSRKRRPMSKLTLTTEADRYVVVTRRFAASPEAVYRAHTEPA